jgi:hypothetical protein
VAIYQRNNNVLSTVYVPPRLHDHAAIAQSLMRVAAIRQEFGGLPMRATLLRSLRETALLAICKRSRVNEAVLCAPATSPYAGDVASLAYSATSCADQILSMPSTFSTAKRV